MTRRRFIADTWTPTTATLTGDQAAHLARVLRAEPGQIYDVVAEGFLHRAEITNVAPDAVHFILHEELESDTALPLHLLIAIFKFDHLEWAIEKATELGIAKITPILARRTEKHLAQAAAKRVDRWRRIALEASKQSRRTSIPEISDPTPLQAALAAEANTPTRILLSEIEQSTPLVEALKHPDRSGINQNLSSRPERSAVEGPASPTPHGNSNPNQNLSSRPERSEVEGPASPTPHGKSNPSQNLSSRPERSAAEGPATPPTPWITHALAIGPEGGWTPEELLLFTHHMWQPVTLGPRILRAETAAIAAIAIASAHLTKP